MTQSEKHAHAIAMDFGCNTVITLNETEVERLASYIEKHFIEKSPPSFFIKGEEIEYIVEEES